MRQFISILIASILHSTFNVTTIISEYFLLTRLDTLKMFLYFFLIYSYFRELSPEVSPLDLVGSNKENGKVSNLVKTSDWELFPRDILCSVNVSPIIVGLFFVQMIWHKLKLFIPWKRVNSRQLDPRYFKKFLFCFCC